MGGGGGGGGEEASPAPTSLVETQTIIINNYYEMTLLLAFLVKGATVIGNAPNGAGTGEIWLDNLSCLGNEQNLFSCPSNPLGTHNCVHNEDLSAMCTTGTNSYTSSVAR